jgi:hypothetical protein
MKPIILRVFHMALVSATCFTASANSIVAQWDLTGQLGSQLSSPATFIAPNLSAFNLIEGPGLTPSAGANSINSSGWNDLGTGDFYSLGFSIQAGFQATVDELKVATRSSATGPGFVNLLYSVDGGPAAVLTTFTQVNTNFLDSDITFAPIQIASNITFFFRAANTTAANGGTIGSAGTFRLSDYSPDGQTFEPITLSGTVSPTSTVPEPSTMLLVAMGIVGLCCKRSHTN